MPILKVEPNTYFDFLLQLTSGNSDEYPGCKLNLAFSKWWFSLKLPRLFSPEKIKVEYTSTAATEKNWYWKSHEREYGISFAEGHMSVQYGRQTDTDTTTQQWSCFLPWKSWRLVRHTLYDADANPFWSQYGKGPWDTLNAMRTACEKVTFSFIDFDGEEIEATTMIEEREWHRGEGWFTWLSHIYRPKIRRSLNIDFSKEVGKGKGSWKGGTTGHGIELIHPAESHEHAFRRYCDKYNLTFKNVVE